MSDKRLAIIIPAYNEEACLFENMLTLSRVLGEAGIDFTAVVVDDGSSDATWEKISRLVRQDSRFFGLRFSRNFGKEAAIMAGLKEARGDCYLVMDADLQHPPEHIPAMLELMEESGADIVQGVKDDRGRESIAYKVLAKGFYRLFRMATAIDMDGSSDFMLLAPTVKETLERMGESKVFFRGLVNWVGFTKVEYRFRVAERPGGGSRFSRGRLFHFAINSTLAYTSKPLYITVVIGAVFLVLALVLAIDTLVNYFSGQAVSGFTTVILLLLISGAAILISLGVMGAYIARIYDEVKGRPAYVVSQRACGEGTADAEKTVSGR